MITDEQEQHLVDKLAERELQHFDESLDLIQNMIMATLSVISTVSEGARATDSIARVTAAVSPDLDSNLNGVYVGLMLAAHCPSLAGAMLDSLSTSNKRPVGEAVESIIERLWELARGGKARS